MSADSTANAVLEIDLDALVGNWRRLRDRLPPGATCAGIVKADAYGLGMAAVAPALEAAGCTLFFDGMVTKFSNLVRDDNLGAH